MSFSTRFNKGRKFTANTEGFQFVDRKELFEQNGEEAVFPLTAIFINRNSKFQDYPIFATDKFLVDVPSHMMSTVEDILSDADAITDINNGLVGFSLYKFTSPKYNVDSIAVKFVDIPVNK